MEVQKTFIYLHKCGYFDLIIFNNHHLYGNVLKQIKHHEMFHDA